MKVKTTELTGAALDWAAAKCEGWPMGIWFDEDQMPMIRDDEIPEWKPSTDWSQGGPIIERERIWIQPEIGKEGAANAWYAVSLHDTDAYGPTPLIAAMRCFVASRLGDEVEVPQELIGA